jgi:hypothetical protein
MIRRRSKAACQPPHHAFEKQRQQTQTDAKSGPGAFTRPAIKLGWVGLGTTNTTLQSASTDFLLPA